MLARQTGKRVLVLGAGYVSGPVVDYLTRDGTTSVTVGEPHPATCKMLKRDSNRSFPMNHFILTRNMFLSKGQWRTYGTTLCLSIDTHICCNFKCM